MTKLIKSKKTQQVADLIKEWIVSQDLKPGQRLPNELAMIERFSASKSTVRESMRILEAQGLLVTKTGPKGGVFVDQVSENKAQSLLNNYFFFKSLSISDIYQIRKALEPEVAASLAGKLSQDQLQQLTLQTQKYQNKPQTMEEEKQRHIDSIEFHSILVGFSDNELLKFVMRFTAKLLAELTLYKKWYQPKNEKLWEMGIKHHTDLLEALTLGEPEKARAIMHSHMQTAHEIMALQEAEMKHKFLQE